jgi:hypothetical protein
VRRRASRSSRRRPRRREAPGRQIKGGPVDGGRKWLQGRRIEGPDLQPGSTPPPHLGRTRGGPTQRRPVLLRLLSLRSFDFTGGAPPSPLLCFPAILSSVMARSNNRWTRWGPSEGVAHAVECALFGACGMQTGHPVHRSARRCGVKNAKGVLEHGVPFPSQYPVLPALWPRQVQQCSAAEVLYASERIYPHCVCARCLLAGMLLLKQHTCSAETTSMYSYTRDV